MTNNLFADIILPLAVKGRFTYSIPDAILGKVKTGVMVTVQFGRKNIYSGIVCNIHDKRPALKNLKQIIDVIETVPLVNETQLKFWHWISEYYLCSEGEVMKAALPSKIYLNNFKPKSETFIKLTEKYNDSELNLILDNLARAPRQQEVLSAYLRLTGYTAGAEIIPVRKPLLMKEAGASQNSVEALVGKGILSSVSLNVTRLTDSDSFREPLKKLSDAQSIAYETIKNQFKRERYCNASWCDLQWQDGDLYTSD